MIATGLVLKIGIDLSVFMAKEFLKEAISHQNEKHHQQMQEFQKLKTLIHDSTKHIENAIRYSTSQIIGKIESDKKEELLSRVLNTLELIDKGKTEQLSQYNLFLRESVDYARSRFESDEKHSWFIPYFLGYSVYYYSLVVLGEQTQTTHAKLVHLVETAQTRQDYFNQNYQTGYELSASNPEQAISYLQAAFQFCPEWVDNNFLEVYHYAVSCSNRYNVPAKIIVELSNPQQGYNNTIFIDNDIVRIGSDSYDVSMNSVYLSETHAQVQIQSGILVIEDLNSEHGTYVNQVKITPGVQYSIAFYDVITVGEYELRFILKQ